jgi:hypothetical protein
MSKKLHLPVDKLRQYFYSYKDFKEKHSGHVEDITNLKANHSDIFGEHKGNISHAGHSCHVENNVFSKLHNEIEKIKEHTDEYNHHGGAKLDNLENKIKQLELENKLINLIVENKNLNSQLNKLIKEGKVDKNIKVAIKNIRGKQLI